MHRPEPHTATSEGRRKAWWATALAVAALLFSTASAHAASGELWKYSMSLEGPGGMAMPMGEVTACRSTSSSSSLKPALRDNCTLESYKPGANKATFRAVCGPPEPMVISGEMTRSGDTVSGTLRVEQGGQEMVMKQVARKTGTCSNPAD